MTDEMLARIADHATRYAIEATVVLALTCALAAAMRRASAAWRHRVLALGLASALLLPVAGGVAPSLGIDVREVGAFAPVERAPVAREGLPERGDAASATRTPSEDPAHRASAPARTEETTRASLTAALLLLWLLGATLLALRLLDAHRRVRALRRGARATGLGPSVFYADVPGPMTVGALRPAVLLPFEATGWERARVQLALRHELGHVARRDVLFLQIGQLARAVLFWNPLAWVAVAWLVREAERATDDHVLEGGVRPSDYAGMLLAEARARRRTEMSVAFPMAQASDVSARIHAILDARQRRGRPSARGTVATLAGAAILTGLVACAGAEPTSTSTTATRATRPTSDGDEAPVTTTQSAGLDAGTVGAIAEEEAAHLVDATASTVARVVVLEPATGRVLALASRGGNGERELFTPLTPASTIKPLILAAGVEDGLPLDTRVDCAPVRLPDGTQVTDWTDNGVQDLTGVIVRSSNTGGVALYRHVGAHPTRRLLETLGFTEPPALATDAPAGELPEGDAPLIALGHGVRVSPVQLSAAYATIANGGTFIAPSRDGDGARHRAMSEATAAALREVLLHAVEDEAATGRNARVDHARVAGKTGTADDGHGRRGIFVGMVPAEAPRYVIYVDADMPSRDEYYAGSIAAPAFARIAARLLEAEAAARP